MSTAPAPTESRPVPETTLSACPVLRSLQNASVPTPSSMPHFFEAAAASTETPSCRSHLSLPLPWPLEDGILIRGPLVEATPSADLGRMDWCPRAYSYPTLQLHTPTHTHTHTHHEMLEEPRTHYIGGVLGQDSSFALGLLILIVQEGGEVKVNLQGTWRKNQHQQPGGPAARDLLP